MSNVYKDYKWPHCIKKIEDLFNTQIIQNTINNNTVITNLKDCINRIKRNYTFTEDYNIAVYPGQIEKLTNVECIVNAANASLAQGNGVDGAIHGAVNLNSQIKLVDIEKKDINNNIVSRCVAGNAVISNSGTNLKNKGINYIIHAVGPLCSNKINNKMSDDEKSLLQSTYKNSLKFVTNYTDINSVAFPAISTGVYRCNVHEAAKIAVKELTNFIKQHPNKFIIICLFFPNNLSEKIVTDLAYHVMAYFDELDKIYKSATTVLSKILFKI